MRKLVAICLSLCVLSIWFSCPSAGHHKFFLGHCTHIHDFVRKLNIGRLFKHAQRRAQISRTRTPDMGFYDALPIRHVALKIHVPCKHFHMPSHYLCRPNCANHAHNSWDVIWVTLAMVPSGTKFIAVELLTRWNRKRDSALVTRVMYIWIYEWYDQYIYHHCHHKMDSKCKFAGPRTLADKKWVGPVELLCIIMFNSLWPRDAIWKHRSGSILAHAMACCWYTSAINY